MTKLKTITSLLPALTIYSLFTGNVMSQTTTFNAFNFTGSNALLAHDATSTTRQLTTSTNFNLNGTSVGVTLSVGNINSVFSDPSVVGLERLGGTFGIGDPSIALLGDTELADTESLIFTFDTDVYLSEFIYGVPNAASGIEVTIDGVVHQFGESFGDGPNGGPDSRVFTFDSILVPESTELIFQASGSRSGPGILGTVGNFQLSLAPVPSSSA